MFGSFVSCFFNSFHVTAFLTSVYMLTFPLLLDFWDYLIGPGAAVFLLLHFLSSGLLVWLMCLHRVTFSCSLSYLCYLFLLGSAYYFSMFNLHLQNYLLQFFCIFFICLRSFIMTIFIETFIWTIFYLFNNLKMYIFYLQCHIIFSLITFLNQSPTTDPVACISFSVVNDGSVAILITSGLLSSISWWSPISLYHFSSQKEKSNTDWVMPSTLVVHLYGTV